MHKEIKELYKSNTRPWVIGYSGGKDSTTALQVIWYAISELPENERKKPIYVISSDTLVETPIIKDYITKNLDNINKKAVEKNCL